MSAGAESLIPELREANGRSLFEGDTNIFCLIALIAMRLTTTNRARAGAPCAAAAGTRRPILGIVGREQRVAARRGRASRTNRASKPAVLRAVGEEEDLGVLASTDFDAEKVDVLESMFDDADVKGTGKLEPTAIRTLLECAGSFCYALHVMTEDETQVL